jgi:hypothetical protein
MWVELESAEIDTIIAAIGNGPIVDKLLARPPLNTGAFVKAAERKADIGLEIEQVGIIDRGEFGAYVMSWLWVTDAEAGVPTNWKEFGVSSELSEKLRSLDGFGVSKFERNDGMPQVDGVFENYEWSLEISSLSWRVVAANKRGLGPTWTYSEQRAQIDQGKYVGFDEALSLIELALSNLAHQDRDHWCYEDDDDVDPDRRIMLEKFVFGEITGKAAALHLNVSPAEMVPLAAMFREKFMALRDGNLFSAGRIKLRLDDLRR